MATSANSETELLTEHFGYPPVSLIDDIINSINILAERALNSVEQGLLNASPATLGFKAPKSHSSRSRQDAAAAADSLSPAERAKNEVESGTHQLETLLCASIDRNFDKFEIYVLRNIFTVRPAELCRWIRLSHYDGLDFSASPSVVVAAARGSPGRRVAPGDAPTVESVTALRRRLRESMRLNALLTAERARNEALLGDLRRLVGGPAPAAPQIKAESASPAQRRSVPRDAVDGQGGRIDAPKPEGEGESRSSPFAFLHHKGDLASSGGGAAPLATTAAFTLSQMQALRALSAALSNVTPDLKASPAAGAGDGERDQAPSTSWRRERAEYVEAATRRHLETVHGLELGKHGEVRDGEWQGPGRKLARGEVESLERVVAMLGGDTDTNGDSGAAGAMASSSLVVVAPAQDEDADRMDES
ncbi:Mis12 protein-domain-containing protein [Nemania serpens]|nr:Mis12 protein-domain-containing protein [Nemania serpens]